MTDTQTFLDSIYEMGDTDDVIDKIISHLNSLFTVGDFAEAGATLDACDVNRLAEAQLDCFICCSNWSREKLPTREAFLDRVERRLIELIGKEQTTELMDDMRGMDKSDAGEARDVLGTWLGSIPR